jgi:hypothetical protein
VCVTGAGDEVSTTRLKSFRKCRLASGLETSFAIAPTLVANHPLADGDLKVWSGGCGGGNLEGARAAGSHRFHPDSWPSQKLLPVGEVAKQRVIILADCVVALARTLPQSFYIGNLNAAACILQKAGLLKRVSDNGDAGPSDA